MDPISLTLLAAVASGGAGLVFLAARSAHVGSLRRQLERQLADVPPDLAKRWTRDPVIAGVAGVTAIDAIHGLSQIDPSVLEAIDAAHGAKAFESYPELVEHVQDVAGRGDAAFSGMVSQYKGYLGEQAVAEHLRAQGHHVEMPDAPNEAGIDAWVDGQPVQIKSGLDASGISEHLERYPDVPVITVAEHADAFAGEEMVTVLPEVSGATLEATTTETLQGIEGVGDFALDIPIITAVISGATNIYRVARGDSDIGTAAEFTAADTIGVGFGGVAGAKAGALAGSFLGPIGAAVGAIGGGIGGALFGRQLSGLFKERKLRAAQKDLRTALMEIPRAHLEALESKEWALEQHARSVQPRGLWPWLWPNGGWVVRRKIADRYRAWAWRCRVAASRLNGEIYAAAGSAGQDGVAELGQRLLQGGAREPVFSARLQGLVTRMGEAVERINVELRKLGRAP